MQKITDRTIVKICVLTAIICLLFGICFKYRYRLREPVFVEQNTEAPLIYEENGERTGWYADVLFHYITGKDEDRLVQSIEFPDLNQSSFRGEAAETMEIRGEYIIHTLSGRIYLSSAVNIEESMMVRGGKIMYSDGTTEEVRLGNILLTREIEEDRSAGVLSSSAQAINRRAGNYMNMEIDISAANYIDIWKYLNRRGVFEDGVQK